MVKSIALIALGVLVALGGQFCLKAGMNEVGRISSEIINQPFATLFKMLSNLRVLFGLFLYFVSAIIWMVVLSRVDLSFAYPIIGINFIMVLLVSRFALGEQVGVIRWIGAVVIFIGVSLVGLEKYLEKMIK